MLIDIHVHHCFRYFVPIQQLRKHIGYLNKYIIWGKHIGKLTYNPQIPTPEHINLHSAEGTQHLQGITNGFNQNPVAFTPGGCKGMREFFWL